MSFRRHLPLYVLVLLIVLCVGYSYVRFMVIDDYMVAYEGACDPTAQSCFVGCVDEDEDDECSEEYYYAQVEKYAVNLYAQCGEDITDCAAANVCLPQGDEQCSVTYCDPMAEPDGCSTFTEEADAVSDDIEAPDAVMDDAEEPDITEETDL